MARIEDSVLIHGDDETYRIKLETEAALPDTAAELINRVKQAIKTEVQGGCTG